MGGIHMSSPPNRINPVNDPKNESFGTGSWGGGGWGNPPIEALPIGYYLGLITSFYQYPNSPKFNQFLYLCLKLFSDIQQCYVSMDLAFDLDVAVGAQLDVLGSIAGVSRTVPFQPSNSVSPVLDDATYRVLIKATIFNNQWDGLVGSLYSFWQNLFPGGKIVIVDNQNMTANILISGAFTSILQDLISHDMVVPRPETVGYIYVFATEPVFGFDADNSYVAGWDTGHWA
jgi:hypothetical protein